MKDIWRNPAFLFIFAYIWISGVATLLGKRDEWQVLLNAFAFLMCLGVLAYAIMELSSARGRSKADPDQSKTAPDQSETISAHSKTISDQSKTVPAHSKTISDHSKTISDQSKTAPDHSKTTPDK